jgi:hypothetical protein
MTGPRQNKPGLFSVQLKQEHSPMAHYMTRHLEASIDLLHGDRLVAKGERFEAVDVDADYYIQRRKAVEVKEDAPKKAATPAQTPAAKPKPEPAEAKKPAVTPRATSAAAAPRAAAPAPAEAMLTTTRDLPGPGQDQVKPSDDAKAEPQA